LFQLPGVWFNIAFFRPAVDYLPVGAQAAAVKLDTTTNPNVLAMSEYYES
jgi:hypothetical protein